MPLKSHIQAFVVYQLNVILYPQADQKPYPCFCSVYQLNVSLYPQAGQSHIHAFVVYLNLMSSYIHKLTNGNQKDYLPSKALQQFLFHTISL